MSDEHDSWIEGLGVDVGSIVESIREPSAGATVNAVGGGDEATRTIESVTSVVETVRGGVNQVIDTTVGVVRDAAETVGERIEDLGGGIIGAGEEVREAAESLDASAFAADVSANSSFEQGIAARIITKLKNGEDLRFDVAMLSNMDMPTLLNVMQELKNAGQLKEFARVIPTQQQRITVAILTTQPDLGDLWLELMANMNDVDRAAIFQRVPEEARERADGTKPKRADPGSPDENEDDDDLLDPSQGIDIENQAVQTQVEIKVTYRESPSRTRTVPVKLSLTFSSGAFQGLEAELDILRKKIASQVGFGLATDVAVALTFNAEMKFTREEADQVLPQLAAKIKATLSFELKIPGVGKKIPVEISVGVGPKGAPETEIKVTLFKF